VGSKKEMKTHWITIEHDIQVLEATGIWGSKGRRPMWVDELIAQGLLPKSPMPNSTMIIDAGLREIIKQLKQEVKEKK